MARQADSPGSTLPPVPPPSSPATSHACHHPGLTMGETSLRRLPDGSWIATAPIGTIFGSPVQGECTGTGATREEALASLDDDRRKLAESIWG